jgi:hypothetical protein
MPKAAQRQFSPLPVFTAASENMWTSEGPLKSFIIPGLDFGTRTAFAG